MALLAGGSIVFVFAAAKDAVQVRYNDARVVFQVCFLGLRRLFAVLLAADGREAVEEQLAQVGERDGVPAGDALADDLLDQVAEEEIYGFGGGEVLDVGQELIGNLFVCTDFGEAGLAVVIGADRGVAERGHAAVVPSGGDLLAEMRTCSGMGGWGHPPSVFARI